MDNIEKAALLMQAADYTRSLQVCAIPGHTIMQRGAPAGMTMDVALRAGCQAKLPEVRSNGPKLSRTTGRRMYLPQAPITGSAWPAKTLLSLLQDMQWAIRMLLPRPNGAPAPPVPATAACG